MVSDQYDSVEEAEDADGSRSLFDVDFDRGGEREDSVIETALERGDGDGEGLPYLLIEGF